MRKATTTLLLWAALSACAPPGPFGEQPVAPVGAGGEWRPLAPLPAPQQEAGVAALDGVVYVVGGFDEFVNVVASVIAYDAASDEWRAAADLPLALHHANVAAAAGLVVVAGFLTGSSFDADGRVLLYDPLADEWSLGAPLPPGSERGGSAVAVLDERVYVIGGLRDVAVTDVSRYDVAGDRWETLPPLPEPRDHVVAGAIDGKIYVAGGRARTIESHAPALFVFDPVVESWSEAAPMPTSRAGAAAAVSGGKLFVMGGEGYREEGSGVFPQVEAYDPAGDEWTRLAPMTTPRHGMGAAAIDGVIVVPGGGDAQGFAAVDVNEGYLP